MRELRTELQTLINSGHCLAHSTFDIVLTDGELLFVSSAEWHVNRFGKNQQYLARIPPDGIQELSMSVDIETDGLEFSLTNVDMVIGRLLTSSVRRLDGAEAVLGTMFLEIGGDPVNAIWDARMAGFLASNQVGDETVDFGYVSTLDGITIAGRTIASEFQWQEPISNIPQFTPTTNPFSPTVGGGDGGDSEGRGRPGRYPDFENGMSIL